jgi:hypothetical protein
MATFAQDNVLTAVIPFFATVHAMASIEENVGENNPPAAQRACVGPLC